MQHKFLRLLAGIAIGSTVSIAEVVASASNTEVSLKNISVKNQEDLAQTSEKKSVSVGQEDAAKFPDLLPIIRIGKATAPLVIEMYYSLSCAHCKDFKKEILPILEEKFINSGQMQFILHDFPTDEGAMQAAKIAWSMGSENYLDISSYLLNHQDAWVGVENWREKLMDCLSEFADAHPDLKIDRSRLEICIEALSEDEEEQLLKKEDLDEDEKIATACLKIGESLIASAYMTQKKYKLDYAPAFIINGKFMSDIPSLTDIEKMIQRVNKELHPLP